MTTTIDKNKFKEYTEIKDAQTLVWDIASNRDLGENFYKPANDAIAFLKAHLDDNQFELELATTAIIKAIDFLDKFQDDVKKECDRLIALEEAESKKAKEQHIVINKRLDKILRPSMDKIMKEIETELPKLAGYNHYHIRGDMNHFINVLKHKLVIHS